MKPSSGWTDSKRVLKTQSPDHFQQVLHQAWQIFIFSSIFAIVFNSFYADGIDLKFKPHISKGWVPSGPVSIPGISSNAEESKTGNHSLSSSDSIVRLSLSGVKDRFDKKNCVFLDARKPEEYKEGHIAGSFNFYGNELDHFAQAVLPQIPDKNKEIIAYCHGGDCDLSLMVAKLLMENGYTHVEIFAGGWPEWQKAGYPLDLGENP